MAGGLVLGPVVFRDFEIPERLRFGGRQRLSVHLLPGGGRIVDAMGPDEGPLSWSGVFSGPDAAARMRLLDRLRQAGSVLPLSWSGWRYSVVIESLEAESMNPAWIPYQLQACVVALGDLISVEALPIAATVADALALGAGATLISDIATATSNLGSADVSTAIAAAGSLARLVTAQSLLSASGGSI